MKYITPKMEIVEWKIEDVVRTSDGVLDEKQDNIGGSEGSSDTKGEIW